MPYKVNPTTGQLDYYEVAEGGGGGVATNLTFIPGVTSGTVTSDSGTDADIPLADSTNAGLFSAAEKTKLAGIAAGAEVNVNADWNATTGDALILNKPTIPAAQVNSDWNATSGLAEILNKPESLPSSYVEHSVKYGEALIKGQAAYVSGSDGTNMVVSKADYSSDATSSKTIGLIDGSGPLNFQGKILTEGLLTGTGDAPLDTSTATAGDPVWLGANGNLLFGLTNKPVAPLHMVFLGIVTRVHAVNGEIFVKVQNGFEIEELHNVLITNPANDEVIAFDLATGLWKNKTIAGGSVEKSGSILSTARSLPFRMGTNITTYRSASAVGSTVLSSSTWAGDTTTFYPISLKEGSPINALAFRVNTAASAGLGSANVEFGIYNSTTDAGGNLIPGTLEVAFGKVSTLTTGVKEVVLSTPHTLGSTVDNIYWIAYRNYSTNSVALNTYSTSDVLSSWIGISSSSASVKLGSFIATTLYSAPDGLPASLPSTGGVGFTQSATVAGFSQYQTVVGIR